MLEITPAHMQAQEIQLLARWKAELAAALRSRLPEATRPMPEAELQRWVARAMDAARRIGATSKADLQDFALTLFRISEARPDLEASGDFTVIMTAEDTFEAKIAMMRKAYPLEGEMWFQDI
jgi:hypothetical protein